MIGESEARAWIEAYGDAWVTRDPAKVVELFTPDAAYQERRFRAPLRGADAIRRYWETIVEDMQRDVHFEVDQLLVAGDQVFVHWRAHFTWRPIMGILELDAFSRISFGPDSRNGLRLCANFEEWIESREG